MLDLLLQYIMQISDINDILLQFDLVAVTFKDISDGGFSGASIFLIKTAGSDYILKGHEGLEDVARLNFIHEVMDEAYKNGFTKLPRIIKSHSGEFTLNASS